MTDKALTDKGRLVEMMLNCPAVIMDFDAAFCLADHLIANGVVVQKQGEWIVLDECSNEGVYCSVCHKKVYKVDYARSARGNKVRSNYCPNCGAKMVKEDK